MNSPWDTDYLNSNPLGAPTPPQQSDPTKQNTFLDYLSQIGKFQNAGNSQGAGTGGGGTVLRAAAPQINQAAQSAMLKGATAGMASGGAGGAASGALSSL